MLISGNFLLKTGYYATHEKIYLLKKQCIDKDNIALFIVYFLP